MFHFPHDSINVLLSTHWFSLYKTQRLHLFIYLWFFRTQFNCINAHPNKSFLNYCVNGKTKEPVTGAYNIQQYAYSTLKRTRLFLCSLVGFFEGKETKYGNTRTHIHTHTNTWTQSALNTLTQTFSRTWTYSNRQCVCEANKIKLYARLQFGATAGCFFIVSGQNKT